MAFQLDAELLQKSFEINSPCVYWIKHKNHTDVFTEGYVGITRNIRSRVSTHNWSYININHPSSNCTSLYQAVKKYGFDSIEIKILIFSDFKYCEELENKLRPKMYIGWNVMPGGICPPRNRPREKSARKYKRKKITEETRDRMSKSAINRFKYSDHPMSGKKHTKDSLQKMSNNRKGKCAWKHPWENPSADVNKWLLARDAYYIWADEGFGYVKLGNHFGYQKCHTFYKLVNMFKDGWIPQNDQAWIKFKESLDGPKT